jgi:hypothetical protein
VAREVFVERRPVEYEQPRAARDGERGRALAPHQERDLAHELAAAHPVDHAAACGGGADLDLATQDREEAVAVVAFPADRGALAVRDLVELRRHRLPLRLGQAVEQGDLLQDLFASEFGV